MISNSHPTAIPLPNTFGGLIRAKRISLAVALRQMAQRLEVSAPYLSDIEHDRRNPPPSDLLEKIALHYQLEPALVYLWAGRLPPAVHQQVLDNPMILNITIQLDPHQQ